MYNAIFSPKRNDVSPNREYVKLENIIDNSQITSPRDFKNLLSPNKLINIPEFSNSESLISPIRKNIRIINDNKNLGGGNNDKVYKKNNSNRSIIEDDNEDEYKSSKFQKSKKTKHDSTKSDYVKSEYTSPINEPARNDSYRKEPNRNESYRKEPNSPKIDSYRKEPNSPKIDSYRKEPARIDSYRKEPNSPKIDSYRKEPNNSIYKENLNSYRNSNGSPENLKYKKILNSTKRYKDSPVRKNKKYNFKSPENLEDIIPKNITSKSPKRKNKTFVNSILENNNDKIKISAKSPVFSESISFYNIGDKLTRENKNYIFDGDNWIIDDSEGEAKGKKEKGDKIKRGDGKEKERDREEIKNNESFMEGIPDYSLLSEAQQTYIRSKFDIKFNELREFWCQYDIPKIPHDMPLDKVHIKYNSYVKHVYAREGAETYTLYIILGWLFMEIVCVKLLGLPAGGFTRFRMNRMSKYKVLLIKLGEKYQGGFGEGWPVEVKLLIISLIEIIVFIGVKYCVSFLDDTGIENTASFITNLLDRQFNVTGVKETKNKKQKSPVKDNKTEKRKEKDDDGIMDLPEEGTVISEITDYLPQISSFLGLENDKKKSPIVENKSDILEKARMKNKKIKEIKEKYEQPPFDG